MKAILQTLLVLLVTFAISREAHARIEISEWKIRLSSNQSSQMDNDSEWRLAKDTIISNKYVGYIEYSSEIKISHISETEDLGIYLGDVSDADKFFVNGIMIGSTGSFPPRFQAYTDYTREYLIPSGLLLTNQPNKIRILVYVEYPSKKGVKIGSIKIGSHSNLQHAKYFYDVSLTQ